MNTSDNISLADKGKSIIDTFLDALWMERGLSDNTLQAYRSDLYAFNLWISGKSQSVTEVHSAEILAYLAEHATAEPRSAYLRAVLAARRGDAEAVHAALTEVVSLTDALEPEYLNTHEQLLMLGALSHHGLGASQKAKANLDTLLSRYPRNLAARKVSTAPRWEYS